MASQLRLGTHHDRVEGRTGTTALLTGNTWTRTVATRAGRRGLAALAAALTLVPAGAAMAAGRTPPTAARPTARGSYIVVAKPGELSQARADVLRAGGRVTHVLAVIGSVSATLPEGAAGALRADPHVVEVVADAPVRLAGSSYDPGSDPYSLYYQEQSAGTRSAWTNGWTGSGVDVALVDSGVAPVPGLSDQGKVLHGPDLTPESQNPDTAHLDTYGHGTFMAGIIAGHDSGYDPMSNIGNKTPFFGTAPNARIVSVKAADAHGDSDVSQVIAGIDWVVQHAHDPGLNIRVLNLSFGTDSSQAYTLDPLAFAAEQAWKQGIVVVVSAGNSGTSLGHLTDPAFDPYVVAVGADDTNGTPGAKDDFVPSFSSQGDGTRNPDVIAPGDHVQSLRVPGSYIDATYGSTGAISDRFFRGSGTSEAAAFVSGSAADLVQEHPDYSPDQIKALLVGPAKPLAGVDPKAQGAGLVQMPPATGSWNVSGAAQSFAPSQGSGTLEASRGSLHLVYQGVTLSGERDIFGAPVSASSLAAAESSGSSWAGGSWNGNAWAGQSWYGSTWAGSTWAGSSWAGSSWAGSSWDDGTWNGSSWANGTWNGSTWAGSTWAGSTWAGNAWAGSTWADHSWS